MAFLSLFVIINKYKAARKRTDLLVIVREISQFQNCLQMLTCLNFIILFMISKLSLEDPESTLYKVPLSELFARALKTLKGTVIPEESGNSKLHFFHPMKNPNPTLPKIFIKIQRTGVEADISVSLSIINNTDLAPFFSPTTVFEVLELWNSRQAKSEKKVVFLPKSQEIMLKTGYDLEEIERAQVDAFKFFEKELEEIEENMRGSYMSIVSFAKERKKYAKLMEEEQNDPQQRQLIKLLNSFKNSFEKERQARPKATKILDLTHYENKSVNAIYNIFSAFGFNKKVLEAHKNSGFTLEDSNKAISQAIAVYEKKKATEKTESKKKVVTSIEIIEKMHGEPIPAQGSFGMLEKEKLMYRIKESVHMQISKHNQQQVDAELNVHQGYFVKKTAKMGMETVFENQKTTLLKLRGQSCSKLAEFYLAESEIPEENNQLYSTFYEKKFDFCLIKDKYWLKIVLDLIRGLDFLDSTRTLHRDIKPGNLMLSKQLQAKIIDFGSSCPSTLDLADPKYPQHLLFSSKTYFYPYDFLSNSLQKLYTRDEYERHPYFDLYAFGRTIFDIFVSKSEKSASFFDPFITDSLRYVVLKCLERNPEDRLSFVNIIVFFVHLLEYRKKL